MKENKIVTPIQWQRALPHMFIWIDVCCVPQPAGGPLSTSLMPEKIARSGFTAILESTLVEMEVASPMASPLRRLTSAKKFESSNKYGQTLKNEMREKLRAWDTDDAFRKSQAQIYDSRAHYEMYLVSENAKAVQTHLESATEEKEESESGAIDQKETLEYGRDHTTSDHRQTRLGCPPWLTHTKFWLDKAVLSIAAYVERSCMILVRENKRKKGQERRIRTGTDSPSTPTHQPNLPPPLSSGTSSARRAQRTKGRNLRLRKLAHAGLVSPGAWSSDTVFLNKAGHAGEQCRKYARVHFPWRRNIPCAVPRVVQLLRSRARLRGRPEHGPL